MQAPGRGAELSENRSEGHVGSLDAGAGFVVDPAGLDVIATTLHGAREDVVSIMSGPRRLPEGSRSALRAAGAHEAYTNFFDAWGGELETITGGLIKHCHSSIVELELTVVVSKKTGPNAKMRFWVIELGADATVSSQATQRITLTLDLRRRGVAASP